MTTERKRKITEGVILAAVLLAACLPLFMHGIEDRDGQDLVFHLLRIEGIAEGLRAGEFPVRIQSNWIAGYGYPVSVFYGDVLLYIPALFRLAGLDVLASYKIFCVLIHLGTLFIARLSFRRMFRDSLTGTICAAAYLLATYRMVNVYIRQAVGEYTAVMFLPLVAAAVWGIYTENADDWQQYRKNALYLCAGMSGIILTHVLSTEMTAVVLVCVCLFFLRKTFRKNTLRVWIRGAWMTALTCLWFLVPFADYFLREPVTVTAGSGDIRVIQQDGVRLWDFFAFFRSPFGHTYSDVAQNGGPLMLLTPGLVLMAAFIAVPLLILAKKLPKKIFVLWLFSAVSLWVSSNLFPWNFIAYSVPGGSLLTQVQFPWRYLGFADLFLVILLGAVISSPLFTERPVLRQQTAVATTAVQLLVAVIFFATYLAGADVHVYTEPGQMNTFYIGREEYLLTGTDIHTLSGEVRTTPEAKAELLKRSGTTTQIRLSGLKEDTEVIFPVLAYTGYHVTDDLGQEYTIQKNEQNEAVVTVKAPFEGTLALSFKEPLTWRLSFWISVVSVIAFILLSVIPKNMRR